jgi:hypothetical protein
MIFSLFFSGCVVEAVTNSCEPESIALCAYSGPAGTEGVGPCRPGTKVCLPDGSGFAACIGEVVPGVETCDTPLDDDCDGLVNEDGSGCACEPGAITSCYSGQASTSTRGVCRMGLQVCTLLGAGFSECVGEVLPGLTEDCSNVLDDNCDGRVNEMPCACVPNMVSSCYNGGESTLGVGLCSAGLLVCGDDGVSYGACYGQVLPRTEDCADPRDENCDGRVCSEPQWGHLFATDKRRCFVMPACSTPEAACSSLSVAWSSSIARYTSRSSGSRSWSKAIPLRL